MHSTRTEFRCLQCDSIFKSYQQLYYHRRTVHCNANYVCDICNRQFKTNCSLGRHQDVHYSNNIICELCNSTYKSIRLLRAHKRYAHKRNGISICDECDKQFTKKSYFVIHFRSEHRHYQSTSAANKFICNDCGSIFASERSLKWHINSVHKKIKDVVCDICERSYSRKDYQRHYQRMHIQENKQYKCQLCDDKSFANANNFNGHIRIIHNRKYLYKCDECEKTTKTAKQLFSHISYRHRQSSIRLFDCDKCGKSFKLMSNMKHHIASFHSNDPYKCRCNICGKYYKSIELMRRHQRKTHSTRRYQCDRCEQIIKFQSGLVRHIRICDNKAIEHEHQ